MKKHLIFNLKFNSYENQGLQITRFKLTPFIKLETIAIIIGKLICKETNFYDLDKQLKVN
jgi:hypothetical protein